MPNMLYRCETVENGARCANQSVMEITVHCACGQHGKTETYNNCREHAQYTFRSAESAGDTCTWVSPWQDR